MRLKCKYSIVFEWKCAYFNQINGLISSFFTNFARECVVFWKNLHSWKIFNTTTSRDSHDKFQVWRCSTYPKNDNPTPKLKFWIFNYLGRVNLPKKLRIYGQCILEIIHGDQYYWVGDFKPTCQGVEEKPFRSQPPDINKKHPSFHYLTLPIWTFYRTIILQNFIKEQLWIFSPLILFLSSNKRFSGFKSRWQIEWLEEKNVNSFP